MRLQVIEGPTAFEDREISPDDRGVGVAARQPVETLMHRASVRDGLARVVGGQSKWPQYSLGPPPDGESLLVDGDLGVAER
jgi:hypothetical protein